MLDLNRKSHESLTIDTLAKMDREELVARWIEIYSIAPPKGIKRGLMERATAYQLQNRPGQRLRAATKKQLLRIAEGTTDVVVARTAADLLSGTRLLREWNGMTHQVDVTDRGFIWQGKIYKTLSAVAVAITGAHWSGPRFFGL